MATSSSHSGGRLKSYTIEFKVEAVEWHRMNGENVSMTSKKFSVDRKRVREWNTKFDQLLAQCSRKQKKKRKIHQGKQNKRKLY